VSHSVFSSVRIALRGGGDLGSGVAYRAARAGFPVLITELPAPLLVRRGVSYGSAVLDGTIMVDGVTARHATTLDEALRIQQSGEIAVMADPAGAVLHDYRPDVIVDARMLKADPGTQRIGESLVIGMGPGFTVPGNCDAVIETNRGHHLGRVIWQGSAEADTGLPGDMLGQTGTRVLRAPINGTIRDGLPIGSHVTAGTAIARVDDHALNAPFDGILRGLLHDGQQVEAGLKIGDLDPRGDPAYCFSISDKSLAIGGGVMEAILCSPLVQRRLSAQRA